MEDQRNYQVLKVEESVLAKVPKESFYMEVVGRHEFKLPGKIVYVPKHWRNSFVVPGSKIILNRHFYGIRDEDLGRRIVAKVKVVKKTTQDGQEFVMIDIFKDPNGTKPTRELKFLINGQGDIQIPGTDTKIAFRAIV